MQTTCVHNDCCLIRFSLSICNVTCFCPCRHDTGGIDQEIDSILEDLGDIQDQSLVRVIQQEVCVAHH